MSSRPPGGFDEYGAAWDSDNDDMLQGLYGGSNGAAKIQPINFVSSGIMPPKLLESADAVPGESTTEPPPPSTSSDTIVSLSTPVQSLPTSFASRPIQAKPKLDPNFAAFVKTGSGFGLRMLLKMGFRNALGKQEEGVTDIIQVQVRPRNAGLGSITEVKNVELNPALRAAEEARIRAEAEAKKLKKLLQKAEQSAWRRGSTQRVKAIKTVAELRAEVASKVGADAAAEVMGDESADADVIYDMTGPGVRLRGVAELGDAAEADEDLYDENTIRLPEFKQNLEFLLLRVRNLVIAAERATRTRAAARRLLQERSDALAKEREAAAAHAERLARAKAMVAGMRAHVQACEEVETLLLTGGAAALSRLVGAPTDIDADADAEDDSMRDDDDDIPIATASAAAALHRSRTRPSSAVISPAAQALVLGLPDTVRGGPTALLLLHVRMRTLAKVRETTDQLLFDFPHIFATLGLAPIVTRVALPLLSRICDSIPSLSWTDLLKPINTLISESVAVPSPRRPFPLPLQAGSPLSAPGATPIAVFALEIVEWAYLLFHADSERSGPKFVLSENGMARLLPSFRALEAVHAHQHFADTLVALLNAISRHWSPSPTPSSTLPPGLADPTCRMLLQLRVVLPDPLYVRALQATLIPRLSHLINSITLPAASNAAQLVDILAPLLSAPEQSRVTVLPVSLHDSVFAMVRARIHQLAGPSPRASFARMCSLATDLYDLVSPLLPASGTADAAERRYVLPASVSDGVMQRTVTPLLAALAEAAPADAGSALAPALGVWASLLPVESLRKAVWPFLSRAAMALVGWAQTLLGAPAPAALPGICQWWQSHVARLPVALRRSQLCSGLFNAGWVLIEAVTEAVSAPSAAATSATVAAVAATQAAITAGLPRVFVAGAATSGVPGASSAAAAAEARLVEDSEQLLGKELRPQQLQRLTTLNMETLPLIALLRAFCEVAEISFERHPSAMLGHHHVHRLGSALVCVDGLKVMRKVGEQWSHAAIRDVLRECQT